VRLKAVSFLLAQLISHSTNTGKTLKAFNIDFRNNYSHLFRLILKFLPFSYSVEDNCFREVHDVNPRRDKRRPKFCVHL
jgi:hypothetical protein